MSDKTDRKPARKDRLKISTRTIGRMTQLWAQKLSTREIAAILRSEGVTIDQRQVLGVTGRPANRSLFPKRTREERIACCSRGQWHGPARGKKRKSRKKLEATLAPGVLEEAIAMWAAGSLGRVVAEVLGMEDKRFWKFLDHRRDQFPYRNRKLAGVWSPTPPKQEDQKAP